ncbi:diaminopimelate decarboxylase [Halobaculum magnesiiphilum]|uniref:Diaminopimelate decarboxylase n=1 Tax=Halobaculum magnesiiphilum TaxID=1017351 RepID=A0A8T8WCV8_9EURY|nr:diaminopimelate decarboxylase [Halobaculum magnesiiphilum]QZP37661.1 diaminopimelate decarboxylase [Halobaculum magnesiiphilum]
MSDEQLRGAENPPIRRLAEWDVERLRELAGEQGTPLYVTDTDRVAENCARLRAAFPDADVKYAAKAHTGRAVLETVREAGLDAECASAGEVRRALDAGFPGARVDYTAVNPPARDLDSVVEWWDDHPDITVTVGARDTLDRLAERGYDGRVCVRVNPGVGAGHHEKVRTGAAPKFGVPYDRAAEVVADARDRFEVVGVHAHAGSGIHGEEDLAAHRDLVARMGELAREIGDDELEFVDVGGGFGVPYHEDDPALDLDSVADATREALGDLDATLAVEPGRYVVADAGVLLTRVNTVKPTAETTVAGVDAGMTDLLRPAMYDAYHAIRNLDAGDAGDARETGPVTVAGPICETGDTFCDGRELPLPDRGDLLAVGNAGAYGYEMASTYNSRPRLAEVSLAGDVLRERETLAGVTRLERGGADE